MGASVPVYVKVVKTYTEVIEVSAVTTEEAEDIARTVPDVVQVLESSYEEFS